MDERSEMHEKGTCMMDHYNEALEELMGAQDYARKAYHAKTMEARSKYSQMARQELAHAEEFKQMAAQAAQGDPMLTMMWPYLQHHIDGWREGITEKIKRAEHKTM